MIKDFNCTNIKKMFKSLARTFISVSSSQSRNKLIIKNSKRLMIGAVFTGGLNHENMNNSDQELFHSSSSVKQVVMDSVNGYTLKERILASLLLAAAGDAIGECNM